MSPGHTLRRIGLDHNPLRRTSDRVEAWLTLLVVAAFVLVLPCATWRAGRTAYAAGVHTERFERAHRFTVEATIVKDPNPDSGAAATAPSDVAVPSRASDAAERVPVPARWVGVDGAEHGGSVMVNPRTRSGTRVPVWTDPQGRLTDPPQQRLKTIIDSGAIGAVTAVGGAMVLAVVRLLTRRTLDARRLAQWGEAWWQFEPRWSGRSGR